ncbi:MAG: MCE family protein [Nocardioidaceae bacterium]
MLILRRRALGICFIMVLLAAVWFTYAIFNKTFVSVVPVQVHADRVGLELPQNADVKVRGVIVGEVRGVSTNGHGATLDLALNPGAVSSIPKNVTARILPKTLFGEKFVALVIPRRPSQVPLAAGDVISQAHVSIEVEQVLADAYPLLRAIHPADLSYTLNALATALEGRGTAIGHNLVSLDGYLKKINPLVPSVVTDLNELTHVSDMYRRVLPGLSRVLDNTVRTGRTVVAKRQALQALFADVTGLSSTTRDFLQANGDNIIRLGKVSLPTAQLLARYSPEYPCLAEGLVNWIPRMTSAYRDHTLHINMEILPKQPSGYSAAERPIYGAKNPPTCLTLPNPPYSQANPGPQPGYRAINDGVRSNHGVRRPAPHLDWTSGYAGTRAEQRVVDSLAAPLLRTSPGQVPDIATLLLGPITRGAEVSVR